MKIWYLLGVILALFGFFFFNCWLAYLAWGVFAPALGLHLLTYWQIVCMIFFGQIIICGAVGFNNKINKK